MSLMRTHTQQYARSEYHTQLAKMSFDKIFDLTAGVYFYYNIHSRPLSNVTTAAVSSSDRVLLYIISQKHVCVRLRQLIGYRRLHKHLLFSSVRTGDITIVTIIVHAPEYCLIK